MSARYPFSAIAGQDELKQALLLTAVDPLIGGLLAFGDRGTGKSTAVRALAALLPEIRATHCAYHCDPDQPSAQCEACRKEASHKVRKIPIPVVDLPLGATEDRVLGALNLERALSHGEKCFEPGLLAQANRGYLYVDDVVEREGLSVRHPARVVLVGSGNPEEGELRPQLLDRFGLSVEVRTPTDVATWVEIVKRRDAFERDPAGFTAQFAKAEEQTRRRIVKARKAVNEVEVPDAVLARAAELCISLKTDGLRGQLTLMRAARALAAFEGLKTVTEDHLKRMAAPALRHRLRRNPLDETGSATRIGRAVAEVLGA